MNENDDSPSSKGLLYQARLPLFWKCGADEVSDQQLVAAEDLNERMLQTLITLQEGHIESTEEAQERMPELIRIEAKLDMLLEWVSQLSPRVDQGLESFPVRLGAQVCLGRGRSRTCLKRVSTYGSICSWTSAFPDHCSYLGVLWR